MTDSRANPKANTIFSLTDADGWEEEDNDQKSSSGSTVNMGFMEDFSSSDDDAQHDTSLVKNSPWKYERRSTSSSNSSLNSCGSNKPLKPLSSMKKKSGSRVCVTTKKIIMDKNCTIKSSTIQKMQNINTGRTASAKPWLTTGRKNSKWSWTGKVIDHRAKRTTYNINTNSSSSLANEERSESGLGSITRTPSPADADLFYSNDPDIRAKVFGLAATKTRVTRSNSFQCFDNVQRNSETDDANENKSRTDAKANICDYKSPINYLGRKSLASKRRVSNYNVRKSLYAVNSQAEFVDNNYRSDKSFQPYINNDYKFDDNCDNKSNEVVTKNKLSLCRRFMSFMMTLFLNIIFLLILPVAYIIIFVYIKDK